MFSFRDYYGDVYKMASTMEERNDPDLRAQDSARPSLLEVIEDRNRTLSKVFYKVFWLYFHTGRNGVMVSESDCTPGHTTLLSLTFHHCASLPYHRASLIRLTV